MRAPPISRASAALAGRLQYELLRALARLPAGVRLRLSGEPPVVIDGQTLDPQLQLICAFRRWRGEPGLVEPTVVEGRARFRRGVLSVTPRRTLVGAVRDLTVPGGDPATPRRARHYSPQASGGGGDARPNEDAAGAPLLVYFHGGGFTIGDLDTHDEPCRLLCRHAGVHVLSVEYRLAPEHPFPAGLEDARAALRWAQAHAASLGADARRVAVGGDSAGGNLAAVTSWLARREGEPPPAAQLLVYPTTDGPSDRPSRALFDRGYFLSRDDRATFSRHYTGGTGIDECDPRISPIYAPDLSGLPPTLVVTAGFDILRDEGEAYAAALQRAGVVVRERRLPALGHGFIHLTGVVPAAHQAMIDVARDWRALLDEVAGS